MSELVAHFALEWGTPLSNFVEHTSMHIRRILASISALLYLCFLYFSVHLSIFAEHFAVF